MMKKPSGRKQSSIRPEGVNQSIDSFKRSSEEKHE
jgi:hypothetical protein